MGYACEAGWSAVGPQAQNGTEVELQREKGLEALLAYGEVPANKATSYSVLAEFQGRRKNIDEAMKMLKIAQDAAPENAYVKRLAASLYFAKARTAVNDTVDRNL